MTDPILQPPDPERINRQVREMLERGEMSMRRFREAMERMEEAMRTIREPVRSWQDDDLIEWNPRPYMRSDPRQGEEVYVYDIRPGARVYVLEDVFTVDRVDMDATLPTVWLKELPTSPLYFTPDESIYLANETED
jgi:hypothetical protein